MRLHLFEHRRDVPGLAPFEVADPRPTPVILHAVPEQRVALRRNERGGMTPVLEQLAASVRHLIEQRHAVRPQPREQRHVVRPHHHIHRVDLQHPDAVDHPPQVTHIDAPRRPSVGKALRRQGDTARLRQREVGRGHGAEGTAPASALPTSPEEPKVKAVSAVAVS